MLLLVPSVLYSLALGTLECWFGACINGQAEMTTKSPSFMVASQHCCQHWITAPPSWAGSELPPACDVGVPHQGGQHAGSFIGVRQYCGAWVSLGIRQFSGVWVHLGVVYGFGGIHFQSRVMADICVTSFNGCHTIVPRVARCPQASALPTLVISKSLCPIACQVPNQRHPLKVKCVTWLDTQSSRVLSFTSAMLIDC